MFRFPPLTPFVKKLLIVLFGAWIVQIILQNWAGVPIFGFLALDTAHPGLNTLWQIGTHVLAFPTGPQAVFSMLIMLLFLWLMHPLFYPFEQYCLYCLYCLSCRMTMPMSRLRPLSPTSPGTSEVYLKYLRFEPK